jgi:hypothetical protein
MHQLSFLDQDLVDRYEILLGDRRLSLVVTNGRVSTPPQAAPWTKGQPIVGVLAWYARQGD